MFIYFFPSLDNIQILASRSAKYSGLTVESHGHTITKPKRLPYTQDPAPLKLSYLTTDAHH